MVPTPSQRPSRSQRNSLAGMILAAVRSRTVGDLTRVARRPVRRSSAAAADLITDLGGERGALRAAGDPQLRQHQ